MPTDYWGGESVDLNVDEATTVDLNGNEVVPGAGRYIPKSIIDAAGDLIVGGGDDSPQRLPVGTPGQALVVAPGGVSLAWATPVAEAHTHDIYATDTDLANHVAAGDPHPGYLTQVEGDARYRQTATPLVDADIPAAIARDSEVTAAISTHEGAADPHAGYQRESEKGQASGYASLDAGTKVPTAQLGGAGADATKFLRGDQTWQVVAAGGGGDVEPLVWMGEM